MIVKEILKNAASEIGINLNDNQLDKFQKYYEILIEKNKVMNLTAITEVNDVVTKHFVDSISLINYFELNNKKIIDVGTGAGFPGIPLAIILQNTEFTLMDSLNKRINFLNEVIKLCDLNNVTTIHSRAEDLGRNIEYREKFDICVSRAVANLSTLLEYCIPFVKVGGSFISYKSGNVDEELDASKSAQTKLSCIIDKKISFTLNGTDMSRSFVKFDKKGTLSKKYPRQAGKPKKEPL
ncbi:MAG: 16S rRNA (guanine(527)-N(7))-methyltransferase RsmG [Lachnospiraceae bacterium]|nr:16S rRNA (guanine(527)-N(7))-methyltransferase RsmG [Lachnospiraceae bacterium]